MKYFALLIVFLSFMYIPAVQAENSALAQADKLNSEKKYDEALKILREYDAAHPADLEVHDRIQRILKRQGKEKEAIEEYKQRAEKNPTALNGYLYARILESPVEREARFREIINTDSKFVWGYVGLATALLDQDRLQDGIDAAGAGLTLVAEPAELHYIRARIYRRMQDFPAGAAEMREYYKLKPTAEARDIAYFYEWLEVDEEKKPENKLKLVDAWVQKYRADLEKGEGLEGATRLAEVSFIYASQDQQPARVHKFAELGLKALAKEKPAASGEDHDYYFRVKGSLFALQAWAEVKAGSASRAKGLLDQARKAGPSSEMFYYSAVTQKLLLKFSDALQNAIRAASYPPVYAGAKELALDLYKQIHSDEKGFEDALHAQRSYFAPERKKRVLAQEVHEKFQPFQITDANGKSFSEKDLAGKVTLINFWAVWCPPCREELPHWNEFVSNHSNDKNLQMFAVGDEPWETIQNYTKNQKLSFPLYRDEKYWEQFSVNGIPTLLIIDPDGVIRFRNSGFEEGMEYEETLLWQIQALKPGEQPGLAKK